MHSLCKGEGLKKRRVKQLKSTKRYQSREQRIVVQVHHTTLQVKGWKTCQASKAINFRLNRGWKVESLRY